MIGIDEFDFPPLSHHRVAVSSAKGLVLVRRSYVYWLCGHTTPSGRPAAAAVQRARSTELPTRLHRDTPAARRVIELCRVESKPSKLDATQHDSSRSECVSVSRCIQLSPFRSVFILVLVRALFYVSRSEALRGFATEESKMSAHCWLTHVIAMHCEAMRCDAMRCRLSAYYLSFSSAFIRFCIDLGFGFGFEAAAAAA